MTGASGRIELTISGMDCADCALTISRALGKVPGVEHAGVSFGTERASVFYDPAKVSPSRIVRAVTDLGYDVRAQRAARTATPGSEIVTGAFVALVAAAVLGGLAAERLGLLDAAAGLVPPPLATAAVLVGGFPVFRRALLALRAGTITPHALMMLGVAGALAISEYGAAAVIVFFMRFADFLDAYTSGRARQAIRELVALQPPIARIVREGLEEEVPAERLAPGDLFMVKPGERVPADGVVVSGRASMNQAPITGESVPVERREGQRLLAATVNLDGVLLVRAEHVGSDSTYGRIVRLVEEAEAEKSGAQRLADRVTAYYAPVVTTLAAATWLIGGSPQAAVAVLVVSCSCGIALATPVAVIAAVGRAARAGVLIKGGRALEALARADVVLLDKTGTVTLGRPLVTGVYPAQGIAREEVLRLAARAERYSEHPVAAAIVAASRAGSHHGHDADPPSLAADVEITPGQGVVLRDPSGAITVGSRRFLEGRGLAVGADLEAGTGEAGPLEQTVVYVANDGAILGAITVADAPRPEVPGALATLRTMGLGDVTVLTGDSERAAEGIARPLGVAFRAQMLPEDKIGEVRRLQAEGRMVAMVGDGINDAPALAQADVGIAMDAATSAALEAADVAIMENDWHLVPEAFRIGREAFGVIRQNLYGTVAYNVVGASLAAAGLLPPIFAAAAQVIPDLLILLNSGRLLGPGSRPRAG